ncbi:hypothetical protein E2C01_004597 [Portunus trituberculatus]|uniref:Uncharacterized protein n=1 Tax=Portunus trituberculatus TaxID=210409 RepID=A0A5B7CQE2_PORTR|nr:hypothetical protein [Portunus trituberculatus]
MLVCNTELSRTVVPLNVSRVFVTETTKHPAKQDHFRTTVQQSLCSQLTFAALQLNKTFKDTSSKNCITEHFGKHSHKYSSNTARAAPGSAFTAASLVM